MRARHLLWVLVLVLWCLLVPYAAAMDRFTGKVVGITDGDTISVLRDGKAVKVRLYGIDAPEKRQAFGTQARQFTADLVFQHTVTVVVHGTDPYGRLIGDVPLTKDQTLSQALVQAGMAWWYREYAGGDVILNKLEIKARLAQRGLWADDHPVPPWEWRRERHTTLGGRHR